MSYGATFLRKPFMRVLVSTVALAVSATAVHGQIELAAIQGTVQDEEGQPLEGVRVRLRDPDRGREIEVQSDEDGRFYRRGLRAIEYELIVEKDGYQPIHDKLRLSAGIDKRFDFKLVRAAPAGAEEFVAGVEAFSRGDNQTAVAAFEAVVERAPDLAEVRVNLALAYLRVSRTADAIAQLEKAAVLAPNDAGVLFQLGGVYVEVNDLDKAVAAFEAGLAKQPDLTDTLAYEATVTLGAVYFAKGDNDQASELFGKALLVKPDAAAPKLGLGKVYFSKGNLDRALELFQQLVSAVPGSPEAAEAEVFIKELQKATNPGP